MTVDHYSPIIISYTNTDNADSYLFWQNVGFLLTGIGIPVAIAGAVDLAMEIAADRGLTGTSRLSLFRQTTGEVGNSTC